MKTIQLFVGGLLVGLAFGLWIGRALVDGSDLSTSAVMPSLLLAMAGASLTANSVRGSRSETRKL
jgi:hypothetical protein